MVTATLTKQRNFKHTIFIAKSISGKPCKVKDMPVKLLCYLQKSSKGITFTNFTVFQNALCSLLQSASVFYQETCWNHEKLFQNKFLILQLHVFLYS